jgi:hypothetical protein
MEAEREELSPLEGRREEERAAERKVLEQRKYTGTIHSFLQKRGHTIKRDYYHTKQMVYTDCT